jgi:hypothetical protein
MKNRLVFLYLLAMLSIMVSCSSDSGGGTPQPATPPVVTPPTTKVVPPGVIVANSKKATRIFVGSPSICILPNGDYLISHDESGPATTGYPNVTNVLKSTDKGKTWNLIYEVKDGQTWSNIFLHNGEPYIMGTYAADQRCLIRKSTDGGKTWTLPTTTSNGLLMSGPYHTGPVPVVVHNNRIWRGMEAKNADLDVWPKKYNAMVMSAPVNSDLLSASNWLKTNQLSYNSTYLNGDFGGWLEGNVVVGKDNKVKLIMRCEMPGSVGEYIAIIDVSDDGKTLTFNPTTGFVKMPGGAKKFTIRYDEKSKKYWTLSNYVRPEFAFINPGYVRNTLTLCSSDDLKTWTVHQKILDSDDIKVTGFQYVDWLAEGEDMIFVSRTAHPDDFGGADTYHNSNYITFHRIENFRSLVSQTVK